MNLNAEVEIISTWKRKAAGKIRLSRAGRRAAALVLFLSACGQARHLSPVSPSTPPTVKLSPKKAPAAKSCQQRNPSVPFVYPARQSLVSSPIQVHDSWESRIPHLQTPMLSKKIIHFMVSKTHTASKLFRLTSPSLVRCLAPQTNSRDGNQALRTSSPLLNAGNHLVRNPLPEIHAHLKKKSVTVTVYACMCEFTPIFSSVCHCAYIDT
jgi:hypothetical protein